MTSRKPKSDGLLVTGVLTLISTIWLVGVGIPEDTGQDRLPSETEEVRELTGVDDIDNLCAIVDQQVTLIHGHGFDEWLHTRQDTPLLSHSWRWCSRGPPAA